MSVAFRRESDEEHLEPNPELPIPPGPNLVTRRGLALIAAKADALEAAVAEERDEARLKAVKRDLRYWHARRATARLAPTPDGAEAAFGTCVTYVQDGETRAVAIVGGDEADPAAGRIAFTAPLARALIGAGVGESVPFRAGGATLELEIVGIALLDG